MLLMLLLVADRALAVLVVDGAARGLVRLLILLVLLILAGLFHDDRVCLLSLLLSRVLVARLAAKLLLGSVRLTLARHLLHLLLRLLVLLLAPGGRVTAPLLFSAHILVGCLVEVML